MLHSMTGFARRERQTDFGELAWEIRAVNHRYLDLQFRLPEPLRGFEADFRRLAGERLGRGKIELALNLRRDDERRKTLSLDGAVLDGIAEALASVRSRLGEATPPDALAVLRWPGVIQDPPLAHAALLEQGLALLDETLAALDAMRAREGERLCELLTARAAEILRIAATVRERRPAVLAAIEQRLRERLARLDVEADPARLETELVVIAQKLDVAEELDRLESHVEEIRAVLTRGEPVGRRLDFLMQELNREANTLGSKSADAETTKATVELKVLIEQMREQVQNVE